MQEFYLEHELVLHEVQNIRYKHPRLGGRKLYQLLEPFLLENQIKMGRDALFSLLATHNLLVRRRVRKPTTTVSYHWFRKYPNIIRNFSPTAPNQLWVSDITYWKVNGSFLYISLITDAFSHMIVGYQLARNMEASHTLNAMLKALDNLEKPPNKLIHHSDRGMQYCCYEYVNLLKEYNIKISMTESGDPLENALAERVNGIIKNEYLECYDPFDFKEASELLDQVIELYNQHRPHFSIGALTPQVVHQNNFNTHKLWKNYYQKKAKL